MRLSFIWKMLLLAVVDLCFGQVDSLRIVCYFDNTTSYIQGNVQYTMDNIDVSLCTHLVYSYVTINFTTHYEESYLATNNEYQKFVGLKQKNPQLKLMVSLPSWKYDMRSLSFDEAPRMMITMTKNIFKFLRQFQFDGLDMNIDYIKLENWIFSFAETLGRILKKEKYLFSVSVGNYAVDSISQDEVTRFNRNLDFINIHTYEFHHPTSEQNQKADHHAPLYSRKWDTNQFMNIDSVVNKWIDKGFPSNKIVMAIPLFGISWTLSSNIITPSAPATGPGNLITKARNRNGYFPYYEICQAVRYKSWLFPKNEKMGPYAVSPYDSHYNRTWVGYDDPAMAIVKSEYILSKGLGGAAVEDVNMDDLNNRCGGGVNPMMMAIYNTLKNSPGFTQSVPKLMETSTKPNAQYSTTTVRRFTTVKPTTTQQPSSPPLSSIQTTKTLMHSLPTTTHSMTSESATAIQSESGSPKIPTSNSIKERNVLRCDIAFGLSIFISISSLITFIYTLFKVFLVCNCKRRIA